MVVSSLNCSSCRQSSALPRMHGWTLMFLVSILVEIIFVTHSSAVKAFPRTKGNWQVLHFLYLPGHFSSGPNANILSSKYFRTESLLLWLANDSREQGTTLKSCWVGFLRRVQCQGSMQSLCFTKFSTWSLMHSETNLNQSFNNVKFTSIPNEALI